MQFVGTTDRSAGNMLCCYGIVVQRVMVWLTNVAKRLVLYLWMCDLDIS